MMKKKVIAVLLCMGLVISCLSGCGSKDESSTGDSAKQTEETDKEDVEEESEELNEYGLTANQQAALLESVKISVTENYLEKYDIAPADFKLLPYDEEEERKYENGEYTGDDPYESSALWNAIDYAIWKSFDGEYGDDLKVKIMTAKAAYMEEDAIEAVQNEELELKDNMLEVDGFEDSLEYVPQERWDCRNAVYSGIVQFLKGMNEKECKEVIYNAIVSDMDSGDTYKLFSRVISDNLVFE